jgi:outer membrane lipoprotein-sorting protein
VTDRPGAAELAALLYRADWTRLSLRADLVRHADREALRRLDERARPLTGAEAGSGPKWRETGRPETGKPETGGRETGRPETGRPETGTPETGGRETGRPETGKPETGQPETGWRETVRRVLVAPGGRFRVENLDPDGPLRLTVCDGESCWRLAGEWAQRQEAGLGDPELAQLLDPSWLLAWYQLELAGSAESAGRAAYLVTATARPARLIRAIPEHVEALVDAELGIVLGLEASHQGQLVETVTLQGLSVGGQAADLTMFSPPPGTTAADPGTTFGELEFGRLKGPLGQVAGTAADLTASALGFAVRHAPRPAAPPPGPPMPVPPPQDETARSDPLSEDEIALLHRAGRPSQNFQAEVRQWIDREPTFDRARMLGTSMPQPLAGVLGPEALWDALGEQATGIAFSTARLRVALPDHFRIDFLSGNWKSRIAVAGDGERLQTQYRSRVVTGPAEPLEDEWARLADPAWLLAPGWQLSPAGGAVVNGRPGLLFWAQAGRPRPDSQILFGASWTQPTGLPLFDRFAVIIDAELGIVLRWVGYVGSRPASCAELASVQWCDSTDPAEFSIEIPPGSRAVTGSSPLAHLDLRRPAEAAKAAGVIGMAGAAIVSGWLQNRPGRRPPPASGDDT